MLRRDKVTADKAIGLFQKLHQYYVSKENDNAAKTIARQLNAIRDYRGKMN